MYTMHHRFKYLDNSNKHILVERFSRQHNGKTVSLNITLSVCPSICFFLFYLVSLHSLLACCLSDNMSSSSHVRSVVMKQCIFVSLHLSLCLCLSFRTSVSISCLSALFSGLLTLLTLCLRLSKDRFVAV